MSIERYFKQKFAMKRNILLLILIAIALTAAAQQPPISHLEINNVRPTILGDGSCYVPQAWDEYLPPYKPPCTTWAVPADTPKETIFQHTLWFGGLDADDSLHLAAYRYGLGSSQINLIAGQDYWMGPLKTADASTDLMTVLKYHYIWNLTRAEIDQFIANHDNPNYKIPEDILTWPAHGEDGLAANMAPFIDVNGDGHYNPADGDYPDIKGDQCLFFIFNDNFGPHTETLGAPIGLEVHGMVYGFNAPEDEALNNTIFYHYELINRSANDYHNTYLGLWTDWDIGYRNDDYVGCDVQRNSCYAYNGNYFDGSGQPQSYGEDHPVQVLTILNSPNNLGMTGFMYHDNTYNPTGTPYNSMDYYMLLQSRWLDGSPLLYGGNGYSEDYGAVGPECKYMFPGDSDPENIGTEGIAPNGGYNTNGRYWTEGEVIGSYYNDPSDRSGLASVGPFDFLAGSSKELDYAMITVWKNDDLSAMDRKGEFIDHIQALFSTDFKEHVPLSTMAIAKTSVWNSGKAAWTQGSGTESDPYLIESAENLAFLSYMVNKGYNTTDLHFRLTADIDLNGSEDLQWVPIGLGDRCLNEEGCNVGSAAGQILPYFQGHFDGGGHSISNIYIDNSEEIYGPNVGLFGNVQGRKEGNVVYPAVIENVFVASGYIQGSCCGGIVGNGGNTATTVVSHCWNGATIEATGTSGTCGGIVGKQAYQVNNCYNRGSLNGYYVGGIVGYGVAETNEESYNEGDLHGTYVGGIYGFSFKNSVSINNCYNRGHIEADGEALNGTPAGPAAGGIASFFLGKNCTLTNCYNVGSVFSTQSAGCILAYGPNATLANNAYINTCSAGGEGISLSEDYMRSQEFVDYLNSNNSEPVWGMDVNNINDGFPILVGNNLNVAELPNPNFKVYPNPAHGCFIVDGTGMMTIVNTLGQTILSREIDGLTSIELPKGMYFITLGNSTQKIVIE